MSELPRYEAACRALAEAYEVDEVKDIMDKAVAMRVYAIQSKNIDLEKMAAEIRLRSERRLGELLIELKTDGRLGPGRPKKNCQKKTTILPDGVDRDLSYRSQKLAGIAEQAFEAMVARKRDEIARKAVRVPREPTKPKEEPEHDRDLRRLCSAWDAACESARQQFIENYRDY